MINKREILDGASTSGLNPHIVEKDYALGWALAGIFAHHALAEKWIFKGGTCLKKCYFETYRFSEDLDFTLKDESHIDDQFLLQTFAEISEWIYEQCGLTFPHEKHSFDIYGNSRGGKSCEGKLSYQGPVSPIAGGLPKIKLDLTADECVALPPIRIPIFHPYSDSPAEGIHVLAYAYEEAFAEKIRALGERARPRDLYDVINLFRNADSRPSASVLSDVLRQKCEFKSIAVPRFADVDGNRAQVEAGWESMLAHQLPALPPMDSFWGELPRFFNWLTGTQPANAPAAYPHEHGESPVRAQTFALPLRTAAMSQLEIIRFAAANHLCIDLRYNNQIRRIEPYSLRRTRDENYILHAWNRDRDAHRSYRVDRIQEASITNKVFVPRYAVELTPSGPLPVQPTARSETDGFGNGSLPSAPRRASRRTTVRRAGPRTRGPVHVYECPLCGKRFQRKNRSTRLNKHKTPDGWQCSGRAAIFLETKY